MMILNKGVSFLDKNGICAVFFNYRYFFFKKKARRWFLQLAGTDKTPKRIPSHFIKFLKYKKILVNRPKIDSNEPSEEKNI